MTYIQAAITILAHADRPLSVPELTSVALAEGLLHPRGKTPDRSMASVLYRRMAADPDAPILSRGGRFWLRGRALPGDLSAHLIRPMRRVRRRAHSPRGAPRAAGSQHASVLPPPPMHLPAEARSALEAESARRVTTYAPTRRERVIVRAGERGDRLLARLAARRAGDAAAHWDAERTAACLVAPLLAHLGYGRGARQATPAHTARGVVGYVLHAGLTVAIALDVRRLTHLLGDDDAWHALSRAEAVGAPYAAVTNGRELRLYSTAVADAGDDAGAALVLWLDLSPQPRWSEARAGQAAALWLLSRASVAAGALDAYVANRVVGAALLGALDEPDSPVARALVDEVQARTGVTLSSAMVLRHARLVVRGQRGRDGEPLPADTATVAAARGPRMERRLEEVARGA